MENNLKWEEFVKIDMRIGTIISAEVFKEVKKPAYKMIIDFGDLGKLKTSAQITKLYTLESLIGKQVIAVVNFPPKQIANIMSECLIIGGLGVGTDVVLLQPERNMPNGTKVA
ncbi:tRNA-binding protein [Bizionia argentinensis JUB59]|uniref:tRNA-binding protein n=2 Tax=Bizionia TaxID=283785 RepID=G2EAI6_9FLAO|nr:tRNA-binding protein [Bizionia argentinensis]EGV44577.2 tRNA-binding protein [Bizionia argentinensis JUB59]